MFKLINFILPLSMFLVPVNLLALENGLGRTPPMGWASWNNFRVNINESLIKEVADAMVNSGLKDVGYIYINIDDGWFGGRSGDGRLTSHPTKFPNGMKVVADYIHTKGLKAGIYSDGGSDSCGSIYDNDAYGYGLGFYGHEEADAKQYFNDWGYDYIKIDWCGGQKLNLNPQIQYTKISNVILNTGKSVFFSLCNWTFPGTWALDVANMWRTTGDVQNSWNSFTAIADSNDRLAAFAGPGHFNDADMLQVGRGMTYEEDKAHFSLWTIMAAPLLLGNDIRKMSAQTKSILTNLEVIAIDQDPAGIQGKKIRSTQGLEIWAKPLGSFDGNEKAILLFNRTTSAADVTVQWSELGLTGQVSVRDLWAQTEKGIFNTSYTALVPAHGVVMIKAKGSVFTNPNLALNKPTIASGSYSGQTNEKAVDGNMATQWTANSGNFPHWLSVDLGAPFAVSTIKQTFSEKDNSTFYYKIEGSNDNVNWIALIDRTNTGVTTAATITEAVSGTYRWVRLYVTYINKNHWANSKEFEVYAR